MGASASRNGRLWRICSRFPLVSFYCFHLLTLLVPNVLVQYGIGRSWLPSILFAQLLNFSLLTCILLACGKGRWVRWSTLALFILSGYSCDYLWNFGSMPSVGAFYSVLNTNNREFFEYILAKWPLLLSLAILAWTYWKLHPIAIAPFWAAMGPGRRKTCFELSLLVFILVSGGIGLRQYRAPSQMSFEPYEICIQNSFPMGLFLGLWRASAFILNHHGNGSKTELHAVRPQRVQGREVVVLVIGESANSSFWSMNGYPYPTDSRMRARRDAGELIYFPRTLAQANLTHFAVPMIVTAATPSTISAGQALPSLLTAFKETGFSTYWISNQERIQYPGDAEVCLIVSAYDFPGRKLGPSYDEATLPFVDKALNAPAKKLFIVVHLMGSHATYSSRVPPAFQTPGLGHANFEQDYARTICYTDSILEALIGRLAQIDGRCLLWYVSDHGEIPQRWDVGHGLAEPALGELQIPMLVWGNPAFREASAPAFKRMKERCGETLSQGVTFPTVLSLAGIEYPRMDSTRDLSSKAFAAERSFQVTAPDGRLREVKSIPW